MASQVKMVGASGQISLGKKYAGRTVLVEETEEGVWIIKTAQTIPDNELWLHTEPFKSRLEGSLEWAAKNPVRETTPEEFNKLEKQALSRTTRRKRAG